MQHAITHDTLAQEWRRRLVARGTIVALLLAVPVFIAAGIGFSSGPGGLLVGISSFVNGPSDTAASSGPSPGAKSISRLVDKATGAALTPATAAAGGGSTGGGSTGSTGGGGSTGGSGSPSTGSPSSPSGSVSIPNPTGGDSINVPAPTGGGGGSSPIPTLPNPLNSVPGVDGVNSGTSLLP